MTTFDSTFTEILVSIYCKGNNKLNTYPIRDLLSQSAFFVKQLSIFDTKRTKQTISKTNDRGEQYLVDVYEIPHLTVECSSFVLATLLDSESTSISISLPLRDVFELFYYNDMLQINKPMVTTHNIDIEFLKELPEILKQNLPNTNVFDFMKQCNFKRVNDFINYFICDVGIGRCNDVMIPDILTYVSDYLTGKIVCLTPHMIIRALSGINNGYKNYFDLVKKYINANVIRKTIEIYKNKEKTVNKSDHIVNCITTLIENKVIDNDSDILNNLISTDQLEPDRTFIINYDDDKLYIANTSTANKLILIYTKSDGEEYYGSYEGCIDDILTIKQFFERCQCNTITYCEYIFICTVENNISIEFFITLPHSCDFHIILHSKEQYLQTIQSLKI